VELIARKPDSSLEEATTLTSQLVAIESVNPGLVKGGRGEAQIAAFVADWLSAKGLAVTLVPGATPGRPNVVAVARGSGGGRTLMLNGHLDTVGLDAMPEGLSPVMEGRRLYGRGASDMKGGVAALMLAAADAQTSGLHGDVIFTGVADEEYLSEGTEAVATQYAADGAIVGEPTGLSLGLAHKGFVWIEVETKGVAAHGSRPDLGVDAIAKMGLILSAIQALGDDLGTRPGHPLVGTPSVHASLISGGREVSTYPDRCTLMLERRTIPGETDAAVLAEVESILAELASADPALVASCRATFSRPPLDTSPASALVQSIARAGGHVLGRSPTAAGMSYWTDAAILASAGIPSVVFGPHGEGDHSANEWVDLASVEACRRVIMGVAADFCG
jgi:acetylornithine deacetylase